jgi:hypothetical protein
MCQHILTLSSSTDGLRIYRDKGLAIDESLYPSWTWVKSLTKKLINFCKFSSRKNARNFKNFDLERAGIFTRETVVLAVRRGVESAQTALNN